MTNKIIDLIDELEDLEDFNLIVKNILECKEYLNSIPQSEMNISQKLWLLAFEASEAKLAKMGENKNQETIADFSKSMSVLRQAITAGLLKNN